jgi:hypothetical protein
MTMSTTQPEPTPENVPTAQVTAPKPSQPLPETDTQFKAAEKPPTHEETLSSLHGAVTDADKAPDAAKK